MVLDVYLEAVRPTTVYNGGVTHNLNKMAEVAGIYKHLWRPEELGINTANQLIEPLTIGLAELVNNPEKYKQFNSPNGWGVYDDLVNFVQEYLSECIEHPDAKVRACR